MNERQRSQIALIIAHELDLAQRATEQEARAIFAAHSAKGTLGSGVTVIAVSTAIGGGSDRLLTALIEKVGSIANDPEAFELIASALETHFGNAEGEVVTSTRMASRRGPGEPDPSILGAAMKLFNEIKSDIRARIEIARFTFDGEKADQPAQRLSVDDPAPMMRVNKGGKPLAAHWDEMWASIAVALWTGDLDPKTQADVKRAMLAWFEDQDIEISNTPVVERARALWLKIEATR